MIFVGIDVAKGKHDCFIISSESEILADVSTVSNSKEGLISFFKQSIPAQVLTAEKYLLVFLPSRTNPANLTIALQKTGQPYIPKA